MSSKSLIILENIRSAYNVGNIIRTADALWYDVILSWFTPHPEAKHQIIKTSLGAEQSVNLRQFWNANEALQWIKERWYTLVVAEHHEKSSDLNALNLPGDKAYPIAILVGNENTWVSPETLFQADYITHISMQGIKESLNVGQAAAIVMRELKK